MADPFSITAGVVGILSSLTSLSMKINEFRRDAQGAKTEIQELASEAQDLSLGLNHLKIVFDQGMIARILQSDLGTVLQRLDQTVKEASTFLEQCQERRALSMYWAFSGKAQCMQFCRRLESHKSTINITLTLSTVIQGHGNYAQGDELLRGIHKIRQQLCGTEEDIILRRYLAEVETVYEGSTVPELCDDEITEAHEGSPVERSPDLLSPGGMPLHSASVVESDPLMEAISRALVPVASSARDGGGHSGHVATPTESSTIADSWANGISQARYQHILQADSIDGTRLILACRDSQFAACTGPSNNPLNTYGYLFRGNVGQRESLARILLSWQLDPEDLPESHDVHFGIQHRQVHAIEFHDDGRLIAVLRWEYRKKTFYRLIAWKPSDSLSHTDWISPIIRPYNCEVVALSRNGRRFACSKTSDTITVYNLDNNATTSTVIKLPRNATLVNYLRFTNDYTCLLASHAIPRGQPSTSGTAPMMSLWNATDGGPHLGSVPINRLVLPGTHEPMVVLANASGPDELMTAYDGITVRNKVTKIKVAIPGGLNTTLAHARPAPSPPFLARVKVNIQAMDIVYPKPHADMKDVKSMSGPAVSPDGSCVLAHMTDSTGLEKLYISNTRSGEVICEIPSPIDAEHGKWTFDREGHRIAVAHRLPSGYFQLDFWKHGSGADQSH